MTNKKIELNCFPPYRKSSDFLDVRYITALKAGETREVPGIGVLKFMQRQGVPFEFDIPFGDLRCIYQDHFKSVYEFIIKGERFRFEFWYNLGGGLLPVGWLYPIGRN